MIRKIAKSGLLDRGSAARVSADASVRSDAILLTLLSRPFSRVSIESCGHSLDEGGAKWDT